MTSGNAHLWDYAIRYGFYFAFAWAALYLRRWQKRRKESIAQSWPSTEARIHGATVLPVPKTNRFLVTLQYSYFIQEYRSGTYVHEFSKEENADDFARQMKDKKIQIRYNQSNPDKSVLEQSVVEQHALLAPRFG